MSDAVAELLEILDLEPLEVDIFRGRSPQVGWQRVFGGLVVAQALVAAQRTVDDRAPHSLHGYFILPGDPAAPIVYEVERIRDGRSFATRRCVAIQHGHAIFTLIASFHVTESGLEHQFEMPDVVAPETLPALPDIMAKLGDVIPPPVRRYFERERPIELRPVDLTRYLPAPPGTLRAPRQNVWLRASAPLPDDPAIHPRRARLPVGHDAARHRARRSRAIRVRPLDPGRQHRSCDLVPPTVPGRRMAALRAGQPQYQRRPRADAGSDLYARRPADRLGCAGRPHPPAPAEELTAHF